MAPAAEGRPVTPKGAARRRAIVAAAAALLATDGPDAVSHRAVAAAARVPLAATTYYFRSLGDLLVAAAEQAADDELGAVAELVEALPRGSRSVGDTAELVIGIVLGPRRSDPEIQAHYERFLASGRHPALRPVLQRARERVDQLLADALDRCGHAGADVAHLVAVVDGTAISALVEGDGSARVRAAAAVTAALERSTEDRGAARAI